MVAVPVVSPQLTGPSWVVLVVPLCPTQRAAVERRGPKIQALRLEPVRLVTPPREGLAVEVVGPRLATTPLPWPVLVAQVEPVAAAVEAVGRSPTLAPEPIPLAQAGSVATAAFSSSPFSRRSTWDSYLRFS